jgi:hypothetical protein
VRGEFQPIATRTPGVEICEHLPLLAQQSERWALVRSVGTESADHVIDAMYARYTVLSFVATTDAELEKCRARAREIADFCTRRWGMRYEERVGSAAFIRKLIDAPRNIAALGEDVLVVPPGGTVETGMFSRHGGLQPEETKPV